MQKMAMFTTIYFIYSRIQEAYNTVISSSISFLLCFSISQLNSLRHVSLGTATVHYGRTQTEFFILRRVVENRWKQITFRILYLRLHFLFEIKIHKDFSTFSKKKNSRMYTRNEKLTICSFHQIHNLSGFQFYDKNLVETHPQKLHDVKQSAALINESRLFGTFPS